MIEIGNNLKDVLKLAILMLGFVAVYKIGLDYFNHN